MLSSFLFSGGSSETIGGDYIMDHIQDDRTFEIFNPLDYNDSNYGVLTKNECYEIKSSFLSGDTLIRDKLSKMIIKKIDLNKKKIFKKNKTYLSRLNEKLFLDSDFKGLCNPKSSTGRLDIFCRTVLNFSDEYEKIPLN